MLDLIDIRFLDDPIITHSARFALARPPATPVSMDGPSTADVRPWNLRRVVPSRMRCAGAVEPGIYDHGQQISHTMHGRRLFEVRADDPSADSVSNNDGDEGANEDYKYDFAPDHSMPVPPA